MSFCCYRKYFDEASDQVEDYLLVFYTMVLYHGNNAVGGKKAVCKGEKLIQGCESGNRCCIFAIYEVVHSFHI